MRCPECYSDHPRITPLRGVEDCLMNHRQYICSTCGRHVCISLTGKRRARCFFPFSSLEDAILYLKCAEIITEEICGIYKLIDIKSGRKSYKIFPNKRELEDYLSKNTKKKCQPKEPMFISNEYKPIKEEQVKYLNEEEAKEYIKEKNQSW